MREYVYIRVSTKEQNLDRQTKAMIEAGVQEDLIFADTQSGKDFDRPNYKLARKVLQKGDTLFIKELDRLGRNAEQIKKEWQAEGISVAKAKGKHLGRSKAEHPTNWEKVYDQWKESKITATKAMEILDMKRTTFYRLVKQYEES